MRARVAPRPAVLVQKQAQRSTSSTASGESRIIRFCAPPAAADADALAEQAPGRYLNRLSDLLFVLARVLNRAAQVPDVLWQPRRDPY